MNYRSYFFWILVSTLCFLSSCADNDETVVPVESISLDKEMLLIEEDKDAQFVVTIVPSDATDRRIEWTSEDESIATVSKEGVLTALKPGKTTVTAVARDGGSSVTCDVYVAKSKSSSGSEPSAKRTVLAYIVADNSLAGLAQADLKEMKLGMASVVSDLMHLLVYVDTGGEARLIEISSENGVSEEKTIKTYPDRNSTGIAETLEVFGDVFANDRYKAESYGLIYWSHCDGWIPYPVPSTRWIGQDTGNNSDNRMNLSDFVQIMEYAPHFDFLMFDACFMQSIEVAYELRNYADYYIASPTETPGPGAPYDKVIPWMFMDGAAVKMSEAYFDTYNSIYNGGEGISNTNWTGGVSICALNTARLEQLATVTKQVLLPGDASELRSTVFDYDQRFGYSHIGYYDMVAMMQHLTDQAGFTAWKQVYDAAVAYWHTTPMNYSAFTRMFSMEGTSGISHYIPASSQSPAAIAYHSTEWYEAAGLSKIGW